jgi:hypothetical protein
MIEMDFSRYAGQLRPPTWRDMDFVAELERELLADGPGAVAGAGHGPRGAT